MGLRRPDSCSTADCLDEGLPPVAPWAVKVDDPDEAIAYYTCPRCGRSWYTSWSLQWLEGGAA